MKKCELCGGLARMHCESDQANLCWDCDVKVHGANFIVAKHTRTLLCNVCQNPTPWLASGHNLRPAFSVCDSCVGNANKRNSHNYEEEEEEEEEGYEDEEEEEEEEEYEEEEEEEGQEEDYEDGHDDEEEEEEVEDGENQVVPWSGDSYSFSMSEPEASLDSLSGSEVGDGGGGFGLKRMRENLSFYSDHEIECSSSHVVSGGSSNGEAIFMGSSRSLKQTRLCDQSARNHDHDETESR